MRLDEGIADRVVLALRYVAAHDSSWAQFLTSAPTSAAPELQIDWSKIAVSGESQGGGHAAAIGRMFAVARVLQLSSPCDQVLATPASWTDGASGTWATDPSTFWGLGVQTIFTGNQPTGGDTTCPAHLAVWQNLGMPTTRYSDNASTCGGTSGPHGAPHG